MLCKFLDGIMKNSNKKLSLALGVTNPRMAQSLSVQETRAGGLFFNPKSVDIKVLMLTPTVSTLLKHTLWDVKNVFVLLSVLLFSLCKLASASVVPTINLDVIAQIESSNNPKAIGDNGRSLGAYQLSSGVIKDYNHLYNTQYSHQDALSSKISHKIAFWYLHKRIPSLLKHFKKPVSTKTILWAYNAGIKAVVDNRMPETTKKYLIKYEKLSGVGRAGISA